MHAQEHINLYIAERPEWQRNLLVRLRQLVHTVDAEVEETWKWGKPHFEHNGILLGFAISKSHVSVCFHKGSLIDDTKNLFEKKKKDEAKGMRGYILAEGDAINEKTFVELVKQAVELNKESTKLGDARSSRKALVLPQEFDQCLHKDEQTWENWEKFNYSHKKEYVEWITDAKKDETRKHRIAKALEMIREGVGKED